MRDHPPEKQTPRLDDRHHLARVEQNIIEALNSFDTTENLQLVKAKLQQRFGLLPATALVIAELAFVAGCSR